MIIAPLINLPRELLLLRARRVPFKQIDSWRVSVGLRVAKRDKETVSAAVVDYFLSCLRTEVLFGGGSLSSEAEERLRAYFGSLIDILLVDEVAAELDRKHKIDERRRKHSESQRTRLAAESTDARNARLDASRASRKESRKASVAAAIASAVHSDLDYDASWPQIPPKDFLEACCEDYAAATNYKPPQVCCCCSRARLDVKISELVIGPRSPEMSLLESLKVPSGDLRASFEFPSFPLLNGYMLDVLGCTTRSGDIVLFFCEDCRGSLGRGKMPRFALANNLFRGRLPHQFHDLTWVEEMVCSIYRTTAHVTRLYHSSNPTDPLVFHGNTCAHDMNIVSTATVLPRTPTDILGQLSVVFVGPGPLKESALKSVFRIRKTKVWEFLMWLKENNPLYKYRLFSLDHLSLYEEDGCVPGLEDATIVDSDLPVAETFEQETAGLEAHPATLLSTETTSESPSSPKIFLEAMGVSDPEGDKITGRTYTASALRNLVPKDKDRPDLIISRGSDPKPEYKNTDLFPGMFPTLFPFGCGGFEDPSRPVPVSFQKQAEFYLDISDRSFRYHKYFVFVALNILQRRTAHLHTHFTVRRSNFDAVARKLVALSPELIRSVADHLERDGKVVDLSPEQLEVMNLLTKVNAVAAHIPGSQASKIKLRNIVRAYMGYISMPHIFFTLNTNAAHSPIMQVFFGDENVDLTKRFPVLAPASERALRLAKDPVAAADFFHFSVVKFFAHMLGWDFKRSKSSESGGILGKVRAFFGTCEYTERANLHGHFLIWLQGGLNPSELHQKMRESQEFQDRFFKFFEQVIHHHLPDVELPEDPSFEPRTQRPPTPSLYETIEEWDEVFLTEIKACGEVLQRHLCRKVCHKYGHEEKCRFQFPHEEVKASYFDPETNSVVLLCLDPTVNYFNPYILVFCRHNHDIRCILSGQAAKAAMFYITDYITKMDVKTYEMLSLLSRTVASLSEDPNLSAKENAKRLLHRCLSQFTRQQQIHAQQAVRYIRDLGDSYQSHETVPMLSSALLGHVVRIYQISAQSEDCTNDDVEDTENDAPASDDDASSKNDADEPEPSLKISVESDGLLTDVTQIDDYWYRSISLAHLCFYNFVRCVRKSKKPENDVSDRLGTFPRHALCPPHPQSESHELIQHTNESLRYPPTELIPRVIGCSIPRRGSHRHALFMMAHFIPFSVECPLLPPNMHVSLTEYFNCYEFTPSHQRIMTNWNEVHECEDERDADRLRKRENMTRENRLLQRAIAGCGPDDDMVDLSAADLEPSTLSKGDAAMLETINRLRDADWFCRPSKTASAPLPKILVNPQTASTALFKAWSELIDDQEKAMVSRRRDAVDAQNTSGTSPVRETRSGAHDMLPPRGAAPSTVPETEYFCAPLSTGETPVEILERIGREHGLNEEQFVAYRIVAHQFLQTFNDLQKPPATNESKTQRDPLRMMMTGPGGTGKTHVIRALTALMAVYGCAHRIRFLAPTGSAAALINGMTVHSGLGIKIQKNGKGKGNRVAGQSEEDFSVVVSVKKRSELRKEWKHVLFLLVDEVSMLSLQLLCELDHALRYAKESSDWFGGVHIIFSGDLYQFPPVMGSPLYLPIKNSTSITNDQVKARLGRIAWKTVNTVVQLRRQMRMANDPKFGKTVGRLRLRKCTKRDMKRFNSRLIKSKFNPAGVDLGSDQLLEAAIIVKTNLVRQALNAQKAHSETQQEPERLIICAAKDIVGSGIDAVECEGLMKDNLLKMNVVPLKSEKKMQGLLPLFVGMPVVVRIANICTELRVANGSQGIVQQIFTERIKGAYTHSPCVLVQFPDSPVQLPGLPQGVFPIYPQKWSFSSLFPVNGRQKVTLRVVRWQLPLQPAFAVTGHFAQGKTLPKVIVDLRDGGFASYVATSRARDFASFVLLHPVTLADLNKPLSADLIAEMKRLDAIADNTLVRYGFSDRPLRTVPDPELEASLGYTSKSPASTDRFNDSTHSTQSNLGKHQRESSAEQESESESESEPEPEGNSQISSGANPWPAPSCTQSVLRSSAGSIPNKRMKTFRSTSNQVLHPEGSRSATGELASSSRTEKTPPFLSPSQDFRDYSCSYDCMINACMASYQSANDTWRRDFAAFNDHTSILAGHLSQIMRLSEPNAIDAERNRWRDYLFSRRPDLFPRSGPSLISIDNLLRFLDFRSSVLMTARCNTCNHESFFSEDVEWFCHENSWKAGAPRVPGFSLSATSASFWSWLKVIAANKASHHLPQLCSLCNHTLSILPELSFTTAPPCLAVEVYPKVNPMPLVSLELEIPVLTGTLGETRGTRYRLKSVIYHGSNHFVSRYIDQEGNLWRHDGMSGPNAILDRDSSMLQTTHNPQLSRFLHQTEDRNAVAFVYARCD